MKKCLIVVDYQVDFVSGSLGFTKAASLEDRIAEKIMQYRKTDDVIIFTFDTHDENYIHTLEGQQLSIPHCLKGTEGHALYGKIKELQKANDPCFYKDTFGSDTLLEYLKKETFTSIELVGVVSNICVLANAVLAKTAQPQIPILVDASCTASSDETLHNEALDIMAGLQITVIGR